MQVINIAARLSARKDGSALEGSARKQTLAVHELSPVGANSTREQTGKYEEAEECKIGTRIEGTKRLVCFEQICPTSSGADFESIECLSENMISPQPKEHYSLDRTSMFGSRLLEFHVEERIRFGSHSGQSASLFDLDHPDAGMLS